MVQNTCFGVRRQRKLAIFPISHAVTPFSSLSSFQPHVQKNVVSDRDLEMGTIGSVDTPAQKHTV